MMKGIVCIYMLIIIVVSSVFTVGCEKEAMAPSVSTTPVVNITDTAVITGGNISSDGKATILARGVCWDTVVNPTTKNYKTVDGTGVGAYVSVIKAFMPNKKYYVRAYASNSVGTAYGQDIIFNTNKTVPKVTTNSASLITSSSATSGGNITNDGGDAIIASGVCWNTVGSPSINDNKTIDNSISSNFISKLTGLDGYKTYFLRAYATNSTGTGYGSQIKITTQSVLRVTDYDGNQYNTVTIGTQTWMAENLKTTHYNDGSIINYVSTNDTSVIHIKTGTYNWYNDSIKYKDIYGALYNWFAITDSRNLCPAGWHIPTGAEWNTLIAYLGGANVAGGKMKEDGLDHWNNPNIADNSSGFKALPGGIGSGSSGVVTKINWYNGIGIFAEFYSSSRDHVSAPLTILLYGSNSTVIYSNALEEMSLSVRCIKD